MDFSAILGSFASNPWPTIVTLLVFAIIALGGFCGGLVKWVLENMVLKSVHDNGQQSVCVKLDDIKEDTTTTRALVEAGR